MVLTIGHEFPSRFLGGQTFSVVKGKHCHKDLLIQTSRWVDNLDYKRSRKPWSKEEDEAVLVGVKVFGRSSFSSIAKLIPGRNTSAVKQRFRTLLRWKIIVRDF